jgi:hypothetical protein
MQASRVQIRPESINYYNGKLSSDHRRRLKEAAAIDLINSKPAGTRIKLSEFGHAMHTGHDNNTDSIIKSMLQKRIIGRTEIEGSYKKYSYWVNAARTVKAANKVLGKGAPKKEIKEAAAPVPTPAPAPVIAAPAPPPLESPDIPQLAKEFSWNYNTDSLREFIKWMESGRPNG